MRGSETLHVGKNAVHIISTYSDGKINSASRRFIHPKDTPLSNTKPRLVEAVGLESGRHGGDTFWLASTSVSGNERNDKPPRLGCFKREATCISHRIHFYRSSRIDTYILGLRETW